MKETVEKAINLFYEEWLKTNDPYQQDFCLILQNNFPDLIFTLDNQDNWILL